MKEDKNIYEKSYFIDMESGKKDYKKQQKKKSYIVAIIINISIIVLIVLVVLIFLVFFYKPNIMDYLEEIKNTFTYGMIIIWAIITTFIILFNILLKDKKMLSQLLKILLCFNIICLIVFFYIDATLDKTYNNEENFGNIYDTKIENKTDTEYVDFWKTFLEQEVQTKTEKEVFIEENNSFPIDNVFSYLLVYGGLVAIFVWIVSYISVIRKSYRIPFYVLALIVIIVLSGAGESSWATFGRLGSSFFWLLLLNKTIVTISKR